MSSVALPEMPPLLILNRLIFALGKPQIQVPLQYGCLCHPTPIPVLTERHKAFRELNPLTATRAHNALVLAVPIYFTVK
jgi:hypothetical protein